MGSVSKLRPIKKQPDVPYTARAAWAHPHNESHQEKYTKAVATLRSGKKSRWIMDSGSKPPGWRGEYHDENNGSQTL